SEIEHFFDGVTFVSFNYDRCVEHFFRHSIAGLYGVNAATSAKVVGSLKVLHPYGSLGPLPSVDGRGIPFGGQPHGDDWVGLGAKIMTYTEQRERPQLFKLILDEI